MAGSGRFRGRRERRLAGQAATENIVVIILVALAMVIMIGMYGRTVMRAFGCAARSVANGEGLTLSCPGRSGAGSDDSAPEPVPAGEAEPEPGAAGSDPAAGGESLKKLNDAKDLLKTTTKGKELLKFLDDKGIAIELKGGDGSVYDSKGNKIVLNDAKSAEGMALTIAHEVNHAIYDKEGKGANIDTDSRADYVKKMIEEEAVGTVASIEMKKDLQAAGKTITSTYPLEREYNAAQKKAVEDLKKSKPSATAAELDTAGKAAGLAAVKKGFETGKVVTSNTKEKYPDYYGKSFDKHHAKPGSEPEPAPEPLQVFGTKSGSPQGPTTGLERMQGKIDPKERRAMENFMALGTVTDAVDLLRKSGQPINFEYVGGGIIVEVKSPTGSDRFRVSNAIKRVEVDRSPGAYPMPSEYPDKTRNVIEPVTDASAKSDFVVDGAEGAGDVAFSIFQQRRGNFQAQDAKSLKDAAGAPDPVKARAQFATDVVDRVTRRNVEQIELKRTLQRSGGTVTTPIPLEREYDAAYNKAFAEEIGKRGATAAGINQAVAAGENAGTKAVRDTIESGRIVTHTGEKYADYFGKEFDKAREEFVKKNPDIVKKQQEQLAAEARKAKIEEARKAIIELVNKVDPDSDDADRVIALVSAFRAEYGLSDTPVLPNEARKGLVKLLGRYGFIDIDEVGSFQNENARLDYALGNFAVLDPSERKALRTGRARPERFGIKTIITYEEMMDRENQKVPYKNPSTPGYTEMIPRREKRERENRAAIRYALESLALIRQPGPAKLLGAFFGEESMRRGAAVDTVLVARYGGPTGAAKAGGSRNVSRGGADFRETQHGGTLVPVAKRAPAPARQPIPIPDRPAPPPVKPPAAKPQLASNQNVTNPPPPGAPKPPPASVANAPKNPSQPGPSSNRNDAPKPPPPAGGQQTLDSVAPSKPSGPRPDPHGQIMNISRGGRVHRLYPQSGDNRDITIKTPNGTEKIKGLEYRLRVEEARDWYSREWSKEQMKTGRAKEELIRKGEWTRRGELQKEAQKKFGLDDNWHLDNNRTLNQISSGPPAPRPQNPPGAPPLTGGDRVNNTGARANTQPAGGGGDNRVNNTGARANTQPAGGGADNRVNNTGARANTAPGQQTGQSAAPKAPLKFGTNDLVYGPSAKGALRKLQENAGGRLLNDIPGKPANKSFSDWSIENLNAHVSRGGKVRFDLTHIEDLPGVLAGTGKHAGKVTSDELRHIRQNWESRYKGNVHFYRNGVEVGPPW